MGIGLEYQVVVTPEARKQAKEARVYYKSISARLGQEFKDELAHKLKGLSTFNAFEIKYKDVRSLAMRQFPYILYFSVAENPAMVYVIAILHKRQEQ